MLHYIDFYGNCILQLKKLKFFAKLEKYLK